MRTCQSAGCRGVSPGLGILKSRTAKEIGHPWGQYRNFDWFYAISGKLRLHLNNDEPTQF
jgi:hypothetical protein